MYLHLTARCRTFVFDDASIAWGAWKLLRKLFPDAIAVCLMGNHVHVLIWTDDPVATVRRFHQFQATITRRTGERQGFWEPTPPTAVGEGQKLATVVRYIELNPCRARAATDPLEWMWSTFRDVSGATADPWVTDDQLADALGEPRQGFRERHHRFVTNDVSVQIGGTPVPRPAVRTEMARHPLERLARAACSATRTSAAAIRRPGPARELFVHLALHHGWWIPDLLAKACRAHRSTIHRIACTEPVGLATAELCLGDERLLCSPLWPT